MSVICPHCGREFPGNRLNSRHLALCNPGSSPKVEPCLCGHVSSSLTQMKRHRKKCPVWQGRDKAAVREERKKETCLEQWGAEDASQHPDVVARRKATNLERYGAENPFSKEATTFEKVQASLEGKRSVLCGDGCAFSRPEVQEKIREHWRQEHGVENPQQVPAIRAQTRQTNLERYGGELLGSPVLRARSERTNLERYGTVFPQQTAEVQARLVATNMSRYGVPYTCMDQDVRQRQIETHYARYGMHWFASKEGKEEIHRALMEKYGVDHWMRTPGAWAKLVCVFQERFEVDHPLQLEEFREKQRQTNIARYGTPFAGLRFKGPNGLEQRVWSLAPEGSLMFTGDGKFWRRLPLLKHNKNPDFIVPGPDPEHPKRGVRQVVEVFGDFWHSKMFTGKVPFEHESELIAAFAEIGMACLVIWESEVKADQEAVRARLAAFLGREEIPDSSGDVFALFSDG